MFSKKFFLAVWTGSGLVSLFIQGRVPDIQWTWDRTRHLSRGNTNHHHSFIHALRVETDLHEVLPIWNDCPELTCKCAWLTPQVWFKTVNDVEGRQAWTKLPCHMYKIRSGLCLSIDWIKSTDEQQLRLFFNWNTGLSTRPKMTLLDPDLIFCVSHHSTF